MALSFIYGVIILRTGWTPHQGRYMVVAATLAAPLMGRIYSKGILNTILAWLICAAALVITVTVILTNQAKPLDARRAEWLGNRMAQYQLQSHAMSGVVRMVEKDVPSDATLGLLSEPGWEYPFFGQGLTRKLIPIYPFANLSDKNWLAEQGIEYILLEQQAFPGLGPEPYLVEIDQVESYVIYRFAPWKAGEQEHEKSQIQPNVQDQRDHPGLQRGRCDRGCDPQDTAGAGRVGTTLRDHRGG
jgi:hypothetical protein